MVVCVVESKTTVRIASRDVLFSLGTFRFSKWTIVLMIPSFCQTTSSKVMDQELT
jgi:hypothetical protein